MTTQPVEPAAEEQTPAHDPAEHDAQEFFADSVHQGLTPPGETKAAMDDAFKAVADRYRRSAKSSARIYQGLTAQAPEPEPEPKAADEGSTPVDVEVEIEVEEPPAPKRKKR